MQYCPIKKWMFVLEEKGKLKVFDFTKLVNQLPQMADIRLKSKEDK